MYSKGTRLNMCMVEKGLNKLNYRNLTRCTRLRYITVRYNQTCHYHDEDETDLVFRPRPRPNPTGMLSFLVLPWLL